MKRFKSSCVLLMMLTLACGDGNGSPTSPSTSQVTLLGIRVSGPATVAPRRHGAIHRYSRLLRRFVEGRYSRRVVVPNLQRDLGPRVPSKFRTLFHESRRDGGRPPWRAKDFFALYEGRAA